MAQATDIVLNSAGYMVEPGSPQSPGYKRLQDGYPEGLTQRTSITDFFGGQHRSHQLERDRFYDSVGVGPTLGGQGVAPWGRITNVTSATTKITGTLPDATAYLPHVIIRDQLYFAIGKTLYKGPLVNPNTGGGWELVKTYPDDITDLTIYGSTGILIAFGSAADLLHRQTTTGVEAVLFAGDRAHRVEAFAGYAMWIDARTMANPAIIRMVTGTSVKWRHVSYDAFAMAVVGGELLLITKQALFSFTGRVVDVLVPNPGYDPDNPSSAGPTMPGMEWNGEFKPFYQDGVYTANDDFRFIAGYGGRTIAWVAGGVQELVPSGDRAGWRSTGLTGRRCFGGCIASGYAIVCIESNAGNNEIWAYDGNGWWCIARKPMPTGGSMTGVWCNPLNIGHGAVYNNFMVFSHGQASVELYRLENFTHTTGSTLPQYATTGELLSPLIDAGDRDKIKAWRKIGAVFSSPETQGNQTSGDAINVYLDYSIDAGATWVNGSTGAGTATTRTGNTIANMNFDLETALQGVTSRFIMLRVRWTSINDWAPILTGLWVEHEALSSPARRRKWQLRIHARDQEIDRDGVVLTRTGRQLIDELWAAWETDTPLTFRDIDYDADPTERTVRIVGISEAATQPFDHGEWGDSHITLSLVEV